MKSVRGKYDGKKVILEEEVSVDHEVPVLVTFIEDSRSKPENERSKKRWHWEEARKIKDEFKGSIVELLLDERRE